MRRLFASPLRKRDVLYGVRTPVEDLVAYGEAYLAAGEASVALDFFEQAARRESQGGGSPKLAREGLDRLRRLAVEEGDAFSLQRISRVAPELAGEPDWLALIASARRLGKESFAAMAEAILHPPAPEGTPGGEGGGGAGAGAGPAAEVAPGTASVQ